METVTFVDGFGRAVQVKKDGVVTSASKGNSAKDENVMIVSGRNMYDAFGRVAKAFYPTTEGTGSKSTFNKSFDNVSPTVTVYDVLDRATSVTLPDNSTTTTAYTVDNGSHALVTTVTDALHNVQATHTNGSGKTLMTIQKSGPDGEITTSFEYDGIQRLVRVTDTEGNVTTSTYDMGDRRTEVNHPASGITSFTYDALGNVLTKQTANLAKEGKFITYDYDYQRLTGINYPDHPENNVKYYYGGRNASQNRIGRLMLREDGTGAIEYFYGKMGEVTKTRRTMIVPNQAIATYVTQWTYDSHNRLLEMIYPDEEKITYSYNLGGQLEKVHGYKSYGYDYVSKIGYDKFEQRTYLKYCNGAETFYTYDPQRRRLQNLTVNSGGNTIMDNAYTYDAVSNVLSVVNGASVPQSGKAGGQMAHAYTYDALYRLVSATGTYTGADNKTASYTLAMGYDNMHRITSKRQILTQNNVQFDGTFNAGYDLTYTYGTDTGKKFQLANVKDVNYRTEETPSESENVNNNHAYEYDANGNLVYVNTSRTKKDGVADEKTAERKLKWDEENRLLASDDNGFVTNYWYDADGERTVKTSGESDQVYVNSEFAGGRTNTAKFSLYVSPYLVANQGGRYTKHIYIGSQRVVSKIGDFDSYGSDPRRIQYAGSETDGLSVDYKVKYTQQLQVIKDNYATFAVPYNGEDNNDYVDGKGFCCNDGSLEAAQARALARAAKNNFQEGDSYEKMQFYYHPDHLGSSSYITNLDGEVVQHIEYVPFGEVFVEERNNIWNTPYLFNAKEFDEETGLYYYGARYYDPRISLWISTDNSEEKYAEFSSYCYVGNNPIILNDPNGNDWLRTDKKYFYDPSVTSQEDATNKYGKETKYLFAAGTLFAKSGAYSYDLEVGGHVKDTYTGEYIAGQICTPAGSTIVNNNAYFNRDELNFREKWAQTDNCIGKFLYGMANDIFVTAQIFDFGNCAGSGATNPLTGAEVQFYNIDGSPNYKPADAIVPTLAVKGVGGLGNIAEKTMGKVAKNVMSSFNKLNAAQFSSSFNKSFAGFSPKVRGFLNRWYNKGIEYLNNPQIPVSTANTVSKKSKNNDTE